jgi:hypothetical protein
VIVPYNSVTQLISVYNFAGSTDVVVDLDGYFAPYNTFLGGPVEPTECVPTGYTSSLSITVGPPYDASHNFQLTYHGVSTGNMPTNASAAQVAGTLTAIGVPNVTVTKTANGAYTIVWDSNAPITGSGDGFTVVTGPVVTPIYSASCPAFYYGSLYDPLIAPARIADTRPLSGEPYEVSTLGPFSILDIQVPPDVFGPVTGSNAPSSFSGVDVNVTVTNTTAPSYLEIFPGQGGIGLGTTQLNGHPTSDINWTPGEIISNSDLLATEADFPSVSLDAFNWAGTVDVVVDVYGYFFIDPLFHP